MTQRIAQEPADDRLLRRCRRVLGNARTEIGAKSADRRLMRATLAELTDVLALMISHRDEIRRQLDRCRGQLAASAAYRRMAALTNDLKRHSQP